MNHTTVHYSSKKYVCIGAVEDKERIGRPKTLTEKDGRELCIYSKKSPFATATEVQRAVNFMKMDLISTIETILDKVDYLVEWLPKSPC